MLLREPTGLSKEETGRIRSDADEFKRKIRRLVRDITGDIPSETGENQIHSIAFSSNDALPKRDRRPTRRIEYLVEQLYLARSEETEQLEDLLKFTLLVQEYYDIADDIIDGDVAEGREPEVFATREYMMPMVVEYAVRLGEGAGSYWAENAVLMVDCLSEELTSEPGRDAYLDIVDKQAKLFSSVTGTCGVVTGGDEQVIDRYEAIGSLYYKIDQFLVDGKQFGDEAYPWNAWELFAESEAKDQIRAWQDELEDHLRRLPEGRFERIRPMIAVDIDAWAEQNLPE